MATSSAMSRSLRRALLTSNPTRSASTSFTSSSPFSSQQCLAHLRGSRQPAVRFGHGYQEARSSRRCLTTSSRLNQNQNEGSQPGKTGLVLEKGQTKPDLGVGEIEGVTFKVEPLKRKGEDDSTIRARLLCVFPFLFLFTFFLSLYPSFVGWVLVGIVVLLFSHFDSKRNEMQLST